MAKNNILFKHVNLKVADCQEGDYWEEEKLKCLVGENETDKILRSKIGCQLSPYLSIQKPSMDGNFTKSLAWDITKKRGELVH